MAMGMQRRANVSNQILNNWVVKITVKIISEEVKVNVIFNWTLFIFPNFLGASSTGSQPSAVREEPAV